MTRIPSALAALLLLAATPTLARDTAGCSTMVVTGHPSYPPTTWASRGSLTGAGPELVSAIAGKLGIKVTFQDLGSWEKAVTATQEGRADLIIGIYRTADRTRTLEFVDPPFMLDPNAVVVRKGTAFPYGGWPDLKGRKGVASSGESFGDAFDSFASRELTLSRAPGTELAFEALVSGRADYLVIGLNPGRAEAKRFGLTDKVEFLPTPLSTAGLYLAFSKRSSCSPAQRAAFANALASAIASGEVKQLVEKAESSLR